MFLEKYYGNGSYKPYIERQIQGNTHGIVFLQDSVFFPESGKITLIGEKDETLTAPCFIEDDSFIIFEQGDYTIIGLVRYGVLYVVSEFNHNLKQAFVKRLEGEEHLKNTTTMSANGQCVLSTLKVETWENIVRSEIQNGTYKSVIIEGLRSYCSD